MPYGPRGDVQSGVKEHQVQAGKQMAVPGEQLFLDQVFVTAGANGVASTCLDSASPRNTVAR